MNDYPLCYICKTECFHYLAIIWCMNEECENCRECQNYANLPHHAVTFADIEKG